MGEVYLGEKVGPEGFVKPVVLKCVLPQLAKDHAFVQLFLDEARLAALLNHPNIAQVYDFGTADGIYYMAMEYVPGYTVDDLRRKHTAIDKWMPVEHVACIATQAAQGLHYAHALTDARGVSLGLVHRDVSPHNLIVSVDGGVKIVDFGIAKARAGLTRVQAKGAVGKFGYMSPEQSRGETVDARTDVFSLGVCLWELTTNRRLHDAKIDRPPPYDPARPIPLLTAFRREVPRQFEKVLETALAIDPAQRYASCQEMHLDLERFLAAMTHYAGQSALSTYLRDLAEGRIENPPDEPSREMVRPAGKKITSGFDAAMLEGAQRYEEVFGTSSEKASGAAQTPGLRAVPASWQTKPSPSSSAPVAPATSAPPAMPMSSSSFPPTGSGLELQSARTPSPRTPPTRQRADVSMAPSRRGSSRSSMGVVIALLLLVLLAGAGGAIFYRDKLVGLVEGLTKSAPPPKTASVSSVYRIVSVPDGAQVEIDGEARGQTPTMLELSPGIEYRLEVRKDGLATKRAMLKAAVGAGVREVSFRLEPASTIKLSSEPPGAQVRINGFELPGVVTPVTLEDAPAGKVQVEIVLPGRSPKFREIDAPAGKTTKAHFELDLHE